MDEYIEHISKHRAKHFVCEFCNEHFSDEPCEPSDCEWMHYIDTEPAADVVEVVRCGECKHYGWEQSPDHGRIEHFCKLHKGLILVKRDTFCSYGERKDDA